MIARERPSFPYPYAFKRSFSYSILVPVLSFNWLTMYIPCTIAAGSTLDENELLRSKGLMYSKTPFERMHDSKSASSDSDSADNSPSFQRFSIRTETPHPEQQSDSSTDSPVMKHTPPHSLTDSSESEVEAANLSPDFPKFRPGLLSENRTDIDTTSPDFPKFRPGLLTQQSSNTINPSPDFSKFRPGLQNPYTDTNTTSPDFPKSRPGLLSQPNQDQISTSTVHDIPNFRPNLTDQENSNISPDFPKFRPGLLNRHPTAPFFKLKSPPAGHQRRSDMHSNPATPARPVSPSGYVTPHLKCPVSPLARTSAQARFPQIRSILKAPPGGHVLVNQQNRRMGSPLMRRVLQHNADRLLMRKSTMGTNDDRSEGAKNSKTQSSMRGVASPTSPPYIPQIMAMNNATDEELQNSPSPQEYALSESTPDLESVNDSTMQSPLTSPTDQEVKMSTAGTLPHVHFTGAVIEERLDEEIEDGDSGNLKKVDTSPLFAAPAILCLPPTPPTYTNQADIPSKATKPSQLLYHQDNQPKPSASVSPKIPMRYSRRKSVTFEGELMHAGPLRSHRSRKSPLSPISSRYYKRRRSVATVGHKQKGEHHILTPSPNLPSHVYRKVSLSPSTSRPFTVNKKQPPHNQTQQDGIKVPSPHLPIHVYRNVSLSPMNYKRRRSISILTHNQVNQKRNSPLGSRHNKRRKSVTILMTQRGGGQKITSPRHHKRRKSVSIVKVPESNHSSAVPVNPRHYIHHKSLAVLPHHEGDQNGGFSANSRHYKRRRSESIMSQYQHDKHVFPSPRLPVHVYRNISLSPVPSIDAPVSPINYKRRRSILSLGKEHAGSHRPLTPKFPDRFFQKHPESNIQGQEDSVNSLSPPIPSMNAPMSPINYKRRRSILSLGKEHAGSHTPLTPKSPGRFFQKHPESSIQGQEDSVNSLSPPVPSMNAPMSPINYKRRRSILSLGKEHAGSHTPLTPKSPGRFFRKHLPSPFIFGQSNRRKSVLVINQDDRLIPLTSPMFNRITLGAYQRSLPSTPIPRRFARRKSLSVITPRARRRVESDEQIQVTMEAARFDVASIYSSKSFLSLAPTAISREKPEFKIEKKQGKVGGLTLKF